MGSFLRVFCNFSTPYFIKSVHLFNGCAVIPQCVAPVFLHNFTLSFHFCLLLLLFFAGWFWLFPRGSVFRRNFKRKFFPIRFSRERISPSFESTWDGFGVDFEFSCGISKRNKILFFRVIIPQNADCRKAWFFPWFEFLNFHFPLRRLNEPRTVFAEDFFNSFLRNSKPLRKLFFVGTAFSTPDKFFFPVRNHVLPVKTKTKFALLDLSIYVLLANSKFSRHFSLRLERPCNNHMRKRF